MNSSNEGSELNEVTWIKSRPTSSYREGQSRGIQTSASDLGESNDCFEEPRRPATPSVRRSSLILGDLRALYAVDHQTEKACDFQESKQHFHVGLNPWKGVFDKVISELDETSLVRKVQAEKCLVVTKKINLRMLVHCFTLWRNTIIRSLEKNLTVSIESNSGYFKQRRRSVMQVWAHVALGINSKKKILERRRGGIERARESLTKRAGMLITPELVENEIRRLMNPTLSAWMTGHSQRTYFSLWRDHFRRHFELILQAKRYCNASIQSRVLLSWQSYTKASAQFTEENFKMDYKRLTQSTLFNNYKRTKSVVRNWRRYTKSMVGAQRKRRQILSRFVRESFLSWQCIKNRQQRVKRVALSNWIEIETVYIKRPFRCWRNIMENNHCRLVYESKLIQTFIRSKQRRILHRQFRQWLHQARFGRITSLYSRNQLAAGWAENKKRCMQMSSKLEEMQVKISSYDEMLITVRDLTKRLNMSEKARIEAEQKLAEVKEMNESLSRVNPIRAQEVLALFPLFGQNKCKLI